MVCFEKLRLRAFRSDRELGSTQQQAGKRERSAERTSEVKRGKPSTTWHTHPL